MLLIRALTLIACWSLGLSCLQRCLSFLPSIDLEPIPGPPVLTEYADSPVWVILWTVLWGLSGILLIIGPIIGNKVKIFSTDVTSFRLDDLSFVLFSALSITWGVSYYLEYFNRVLEGIPSTLYLSGGVTLAPGLFVFAIWAIWFSTREVRGDISLGQV